MLKYIKYSRELKTVIIFHEKLNQLHKFEAKIKQKFFNRTNSSLVVNHRKIQLCVQKKCKQQYGKPYQNLRVEIAQQIPKIRRIAAGIEVQTERHSYPAPVTGGPVLPVGIFDSILEDLGYVRTEHTTREDTLNKMVGILKETKKCAFIRIFSPFAHLQFLLKIPFLIIKQTGFNTDKIENELIGKTFKLLLLPILIYLLLKLGFTHEQLINAVKSISLKVNF